MKKIYFLLVIIALATAGCSSTYTVNNFSSKKNYYKFINNHIHDRNLHISFMGDSTFYAPSGGKISGDSLTVFNIVHKIKRVIPGKEIKSVKYINDGFSPSSADIQLSGGKELEAQNVEVMQDQSVRFTEIDKANIQFPINPDVCSVYYYDHWKSMPQYTAGFMLQGALIGLKLGSEAAARDRSLAQVQDPLIGTFLFGLGGTIVGLAIGSPQIFVLNDSYFEKNKLLKRFDIIAGLTSSNLYGNFSDGRTFETRANDQYSFGIYYNYEITGSFKFRSGIIYSIKGGNYDYSLPVMFVPNFGRYSQKGSTALYLHTLEIPLQLRINTFEINSEPVSCLVGPAINIPLKGELDEFYTGNSGDTWLHASSSVNDRAYLSLMTGVHVTLDDHFSFEFIFDHSFTKIGTAVMKDGTGIDLRQNNFLVCTALTL